MLFQNENIEQFESINNNHYNNMSITTYYLNQKSWVSGALKKTLKKYIDYSFSITIKKDEFSGKNNRIFSVYHKDYKDKEPPNDIKDKTLEIETIAHNLYKNY